MIFFDGAIAFEVDAAGAGGVGGQFFIYRDPNVGGAGSAYITILRDQIISFDIAGAGRLDECRPGDRAGDMGVGSAALTDLQLPDIDGTPEITGAGKGYRQIVSRDDP